MVDLKDMTKKEKVEYIWDYYKLHIIGTLVLIFLVGSFVYNQFTRVDYVFNVTLIGNNLDETKKTDFEKQITSIVVPKEEKRKQALLDVMPVELSSKGSTSIPPQYMQKFVAELATGGIDIAVLDKNIFEDLAKQGTFEKLDKLTVLDLTSIKEGKVEASGIDNLRSIYAVDASNAEKLQYIGFDTNNKVIVILDSSKQKDKAAILLKWILGI